MLKGLFDKLKKQKQTLNTQNPEVILRAIAEEIGEEGVICGGAVRDVKLGYTPKDYDIFFYKKESHRKFMEPKSWKTLEVEWIDARPKGIGAYESFDDAQLLVVDGKFEHNVDFQLIWWDLDCKTPTDVVAGFDYTINMMAYDESGFCLDPRASEAISKGELIFNPLCQMVTFDVCNMGKEATGYGVGLRRGKKHSSDEKNRYIVEHLIKRGMRFVEKLGLDFAPENIQEMLTTYPFKSQALMEKDF